MSPLWKSELRVRLGRDGCTAQVLAPWSRRVVCASAGEGPAAVAIASALQVLRDQGKDPLPRRARLLVPDEHAYLSLRPWPGAWAEAHRDAVDHFTRALGRQDLLVQVVALPGGTMSLAAAIEPSDLETWRQPLLDAGVHVVGVELALIDDLNAVSMQVGDQAVIALMREEGMTVLRIDAGVPVELSWERCDQHSPRCIEPRLLACQMGVDGNGPDLLLLLCRSEAQREAWKLLAQGHGWTLLLRDAQPIELAT